MKQIADLHLHSHFSRATSREMALPSINQWCKIKGIDIVGTSDFTHPEWFDRIQSELQEDGSGFLHLKTDPKSVRFVLSTEISSIYQQNSRTYKIHNLILFPTKKSAKKFNSRIARYGKLASDGRPILKLPAKELLKIALDIDPQGFVIPAHIWTPWFSLYGSKSGFDSITECFGELSDQIFAVETGLSSDPPMNWRVSELDQRTILSNSDAHSGRNLGREASVFEMKKPTYQEMSKIIKNNDHKKLLYTIEFYPEEGKYHFDGHRACRQSFDPTTKKFKDNLCPVCGRRLTIGVLHRVEKLADRPREFQPKDRPGFKRLVGLEKIISEIEGVGIGSKKVRVKYQELIAKLGPEIKILTETQPSIIKKVGGTRLATGIESARSGKLWVKPGFDGVYGKINLRAI